MKLTMSRQPRNERPPAVSHLEIGNQVFHNGVPMELLYRVRRGSSYETWRVRPLFVEGPDRNSPALQRDVWVHVRLSAIERHSVAIERAGVGS
jgi:hypothetical protein